jgi:hypothetical protein
MLEHSSSKVKKVLAILLAVFFVLSLKAVTASALGGWENDRLYELGLASAHGGGGFGVVSHSDHGLGYGGHGLSYVSGGYGSIGSIGSYGVNCAVVNDAMVCSSY